MRWSTALLAAGGVWLGLRLLSSGTKAWAEDVVNRVFASDFHPLSDEMGAMDVFELAARLAGLSGLPVLWALSLVYDRGVPLAELPAALDTTWATIEQMGPPDEASPQAILEWKAQVLNRVALAHGGHEAAPEDKLVQVSTPDNLSDSPKPA